MSREDELLAIDQYLEQQGATPCPPRFCGPVIAALPLQAEITTMEACPIPADLTHWRHRPHFLIGKRRAPSSRPL